MKCIFQSWDMCDDELLWHEKNGGYQQEKAESVKRMKYNDSQEGMERNVVEREA